jgi:hypothetical protein
VSPEWVAFFHSAGCATIASRIWPSGPAAGRQNLLQPPALGLADRAALHDHHAIADLGLVLRIVGMQLDPPADLLAVPRVAGLILDLNGDGLVANVADHQPDLATPRPPGNRLIRIRLFHIPLSPSA